MPNERLREAMAAAHVTVKALARKTGVHPRTVQRWLDHNRPPKDRDLRQQVAALLGADAAQLWPAPSAVAAPVVDELIGYYPTAGAISAQVWNGLFAGSDRADILTDDPGLLTDELREFLPALVFRVATGQRVRVMLHDPDDPAWIDDPRIASVVAACGELQPLARAHTALADVRLHRHALAHSVFRFGDQMIVVLHTGGAVENDPALHLRLTDAARDQHGRIRRDVPSSFAAFAGSFDAHWQRPTPVSPLTPHRELAWHDKPSPGVSAEEHLVRSETYLHLRHRLDQIDAALRELDPEPELRLRFDQILEQLRLLDPNDPEGLITPEEADELVNEALRRLFPGELNDDGT